MTRELFTRSPKNPILRPQKWWEGKAVLNPGAALFRGQIVLVYRAVGNDGISRFGLATSDDGTTFGRHDTPLYEASRRDWQARLGIEDPRITEIGSTYHLTFTKVSVEEASTPRLSWESAPFRLRSWIARTNDFLQIHEVGPVSQNTNTKDLVLFPHKINGMYVALLREYPSILITRSPDLRKWSPPMTVLEPISGTWEQERVGAGPPPVRIASGWLLFYHANEYLRLPENRRMYRLGVALLDAADPSRVLYRHPDPIFEPSSAYEREGPVGNVVFGTGLIDDGETYWLYYGAGDGVVAVAKTAKQDMLELLPDQVR